MLWTAGYLRVGPRAVRADLAERLIGALAQIRRGSETSAFAVPPDLAAQVGCPAADFPAILRGLGLKPAEKDKTTGAVTLWRFPAQRTPEQSARARNGQHAAPPAPPSGPFAILADLVAPQPVRQRRRRRPKRSATSSTPKAAS
jgi:ATP-dependent RNA helicase SUPV3L1/SUV3